MRDVTRGLHTARLRQEKVGDVGSRGEGSKGINSTHFYKRFVTHRYWLAWHLKNSPRAGPSGECPCHRRQTDNQNPACLFSCTFYKWPHVCRHLLMLSGMTSRKMGRGHTWWRRLAGREEPFSVSALPMCLDCTLPQMCWCYFSTFVYSVIHTLVVL